MRLEFVDGKVLEAVHQRIEKVKIARMAKVKEIMEATVAEAAAEAQRKEQDEQARQRKKEQEEQARQRQKEQEEQAPKARGKNNTFDNQMEDLKRYKETHGHVNVSIPEDKSLTQFCAKARYAVKNPGKGVKLTDERISAFDAVGFYWTSQEYVTRSFDERIEDLEEYKQTHIHLNVKKHKQPLSILFGRQALAKKVREGRHEEADERAHKEVR